LPILHLLGADALLPPLWIMGLLWLTGYVLLGAAAGYAFACSTGGPYGEASLWRGLTFLVAEVTFSFAWYSLSFGSFLLFPAWICLLLGVAAGLFSQGIGPLLSIAIRDVMGVYAHIIAIGLQFVHLPRGAIHEP
jgi:hypothetical protein